MRKLAIAAFVLAVLIVSAIPAAAENVTGDGLKYVAEEDYVVITGCTEGTAEITVPAEIDGLPVTFIESGAFKENYDLTRVTILAKANILDSAFEDCRSLLQADLGDGVSIIGNMAFMKCTSLAQVNIPDSVTSIGVDAFTRTALVDDRASWGGEVLYIGNHLIAADKDISGVCELRPGTLTIAGEAFARCNGLTGVRIPAAVRSVGKGAFKNCRSLKWAEVLGGDVGQEAFQGCSAMTNLTLGEGVENISGWAFSNCVGLTELALPESLRNIGAKAFHGCSGLKTLAVPDGVKNVMDGAFENCVGLTDVSLGSGVRSFGVMAIPNCPFIREVKVSPENSYYRDIDGVLFSKDAARLIYFPRGSRTTDYTVPQGVSVIGEYAFSNCNGLLSLTLPDSVLTIESHAFDLCPELKRFVFGKGIESVGIGAFDGCSGLSQVYYPGSRAEWERVDVKGINEELLNANFHFDSAGPGIEPALTLSKPVEQDGSIIIEVKLDGVPLEEPAVIVIRTDDGKGNFSFSRIEGRFGAIIFPRGEAKAIKAFAWESLESMLPLCEAVEAGGILNL